MLEDNQPVSYLESGGERIAFQSIAGGEPGIFFLTGFGSDMAGAKAAHLAALATKQGVGFTRFDYSGHGKSSGAFADGTLQGWLNDALAVFDRQTSGYQILAGSSMGGWLALLLAEARPERVRGIIGIAAAPDFTEDLILAKLAETQQAHLQQTGFLEIPSLYGPPQTITTKLLDSGRALLVLRRIVGIECPVRLIHGMQDMDVPWQTSLRLAEVLASQDVQVHLVKDGEHRLSRTSDLGLLERTVLELQRACDVVT